jgi:hypothetical protein
MSDLLSRARLARIDESVARVIATSIPSQDALDTAFPDASLRSIGQRWEAKVKPWAYVSGVPIIRRPFEEAEYATAVTWPFEHWQASRYSTGRYGVWYGARSVETAVWETAYHWYRALLQDVELNKPGQVAHKRVYGVDVEATLIDLRTLVQSVPSLVHPTDYRTCQRIGEQIHHEGHPGVLTRSARHRTGQVLAIFNPAVLSNPAHASYLRYELLDEEIQIQRGLTEPWFRIPVKDWSHRA